MNFPGELIITGIAEKKLLAPEKKFIQSEKIAGVILFSKNYENPQQLAELVNEIQMLRDEYPLFIAVDQEGGRVQRFKDGFSIIPNMLKVAQTDSPKLCYELYEALSQELVACGINLNFAPVCDILTNSLNKVIGDRSFGGDVSNVEKFVSAAIRGMQTTGILSCAKHFPGHGGTLLDSHLDLPKVETDFAELEAREFLPFKKAIKSRVEMVMMAHLVVDSIDPELPCTLSSHAYGILRDQLKFTKIVITDDMQMQAITKIFTVEEAALRAVCAGADMLIYRDMEQAELAVKSIKDGLKKKTLKNNDFEKKAARIADCKKKNLKEYKPIYIPEIKNQMSLAQHAQIIKKIQNL